MQHLSPDQNTQKKKKKLEKKRIEDNKPVKCHLVSKHFDNLFVVNKSNISSTQNKK